MACPGSETHEAVLVITVDTRSPVPPFEQVRAQLAAAITDGQIAAGTRLPPVRRMADDLGLAVNTVARAYRELETAGLVETRGRGGTVVTSAGNTARERVRVAAESFAMIVHQAGINPEEAIRVIRSALA